MDRLSDNRCRGETLRKALVEGECELWDVLCPGFAPNPFLRLRLFWGVFGILGLFGRSGRSSQERRSLLYNACITIETGERRETRLPPFRIIIMIVLSLPRILGVERNPAARP